MARLCWRLAVGLWLAAALAGCGSLKHSGGAAPLPLSDAQRAGLLAASDDLQADQAMAAAGADETRRRQLRDSYIANRLVLLDVDFLAYLRGLTSDRRTLDSASEGSVLGLSVLGTIRDSVQAKENLAALVALVTGLKSNVDKNYFANRATDAIASMMVAKRKEVLVRIVDAMGTSTLAYGLVSARNDLNDYYLAGTLDGAFLAIQADASRRDDAATRTLDGKRLVANTLEDLNPDTLKAKAALTRALGAKTVSLEALHKALQALDVPPERLPGSTEDAARLLQQFVRGAATTARIQALTEVFRAAGLLPAQ